MPAGTRVEIVEEGGSLQDGGSLEVSPIACDTAAETEVGLNRMNCQFMGAVMVTTGDASAFALSRLWEGSLESRRCSRVTYPQSYITKYTSIRRKNVR